MSFGPKSASEEKVFAIEGLRMELQFTLHTALVNRGVTRKQLSRKLGKSDHWVDDTLFQDNSNPSIVTIAKVFHAIGVDLALHPVQKES